MFTSICDPNSPNTFWYYDASSKVVSNNFSFTRNCINGVTSCECLHSCETYSNFLSISSRYSIDFGILSLWLSPSLLIYRNSNFINFRNSQDKNAYIVAYDHNRFTLSSLCSLYHLASPFITVIWSNLIFFQHLSITSFTVQSYV